jgi:hypothetical protein
LHSVSGFVILLLVASEAADFEGFEEGKNIHGIKSVKK